MSTDHVIVQRVTIRFTELLRIARAETECPGLPGLMCGTCDGMVSFGGCNTQCTVTDVCICDDFFSVFARVHQHQITVRQLP